MDAARRLFAVVMVPRLDPSIPLCYTGVDAVEDRVRAGGDVVRRLFRNVRAGSDSPKRIDWKVHGNGRGE